METPKTVEVRPGEVHDMYAGLLAYTKVLESELEKCRRAGFVSDIGTELFPRGGKRRKSKSRKARKSRKHRKTHRK
jgi:hypothetical protein